MLGQHTSLLARLDIQPAIGYLVACQEVFDSVREGRPLVADHPDTLERWSVIRQPIAEQVGQHRVEVFFGWVPGLDQVVVNLRRVDGAYGRVAVGIRSG